MRTLKVAIALTLVVASPRQVGAQDEVIVYTGVPEVRVSSDGSEASRELVASERRDEFRLRIVRRGARYFWASRGDRELTRTESGRYIVFSSDAGIVKIVDPAWDSARAPLRGQDPSERFDYVEILHQHLATLAYWGRGSGNPRLLRPGG